MTDPSIYISVKILIILFGAAAGTGFYFSVPLAALLWSMGLSPRWAAVPAGVAAFGMWIYTLRLWYYAELDARQFSQAMQAGRIRTDERLVIEHKTGQVTQHVKAPFTPSQIKLAARVLLPLDGRFNLRSLYDIFGQSGAVQFRDWMIREGYAVGDERGMVTISTIGIAMLKAAEGYSPTLPEGDLIPIYASRRGYTRDT